MSKISKAMAAVGRHHSRGASCDDVSGVIDVPSNNGNVLLGSILDSCGLKRFTAKARDSNGAESGTTTHPITIPKVKGINQLMSFIQELLFKFYFIELIFKTIIQ